MYRYLAGLARTCEVLGAEALTIADTRVTKHHDFASISVTAERWLPIHEVALPGLKSYLARLRNEGYALIGLEQTRGAASLDTFNFPPRTALVLGREREGIDADVLGMLDGCVVIEQRGLIRSRVCWHFPSLISCLLARFVISHTHTHFHFTTLFCSQNTFN
jgi:tRNA guanosine-2'-O-methyltransferase